MRSLLFSRFENCHSFWNELKRKCCYIKWKGGSNISLPKELNESNGKLIAVH